MQNKGYYAV